MMQPSAPHLSVNLGKNRNENPSTQFYRWAITSGRMIIVAVELLTLAALSYRFVIDRQLVDLHDQIRTQQLFVSSQSKKEETYRNLQGRIEAIGNIEKENKAQTAFLKDLLNLLNSSDYVSTNLTVSKNIINVDGQAYSIFTLNSLVDKLKENPNVISISIDELTSLDQGITFKLTTRLTESKQ